MQNQRGGGVNVTEEQLFEHERFLPLAGWSSRHLLPTERTRYSRQEDGANSSNAFPQIWLPPGTLLMHNTTRPCDVPCLTCQVAPAQGLELSNICQSMISARATISLLLKPFLLSSLA